MLSSSLCIDASTQSPLFASPLPPSFLDTNSRSMLSLGYKAKCIIINLFVLRSIYLSSSLFSFKNVPNTLLGEMPGCLFLWWDFSCRDWFPDVFLFVCGTVIFFFFSFLPVWFQYSQVVIVYLFSPSFLILFWFGSSVTSVVSLSPLFFMGNAHFSIIIIIIIIWEFFTSVLADGLLLEFKWQQISSVF